MPNALNPTSGQNDANVVQASPDFGGFPGGVVPISGSNALADAAPPVAQAQQLGAPGQAPGPAQQGQPNDVPPPTHEQTAALLYHTSELIKRFSKLLKNPDLGKKDDKSAIVDVALGLAQDGLGSVPQIVEGLKTLPSNPADQLKWVEQHLLLAQLTQHAVLDHHAQSHPPTLDFAKEHATHIAPMKKGGAASSKSRHIEIVQGLAKQYRPAPQQQQQQPQMMQPGPPNA